MKMFLTGGTGFFGKAILRQLLQEYKGDGAKFVVTVLSRNPTRFLEENPDFSNQPWLKFYCGDICNRETLPLSMKFTHVLHAATDSTIGPSLTPRERFTQILEGTKNILQFTHECGAKRFLLTSSGGVYGPQPSDLGFMQESQNIIPDPLIADNAYSIAKRAAENLCAIYAEEYNFEIVIARCFAFIGEDLPLDAHFAIGNFLRDALNEVDISVLGDGSPTRTYLDQRDLSQWLLKILKVGRAGEAYNVGSDEVITIAELAKLIRDMVNPNLKVQITQSKIECNFRNKYVPDIAKAKKELGLSVTYTLRQSLEKVISVKTK
jgi:dTDP-glucose 4,6-dehydratase